VVTVVADDVTLDCAQHRIRGSDVSSRIVSINQRQRVTVRNCELSGGAVGIDVDGGGDVHLIDDIVHDVSSTAIRLHEVNTFEITGNEAYNDGRLQNGIDMTLSSSGAISGNTVHDFGMGGIQFLGSHDCTLENNLVYGIHDTGFGFFWDSGTGEVTHDIQVSNNEVHDCLAVGANEIMHASHHLTFANNNFHDVAAVFVVYEGNGGKMHDIVIDGNQLTDSPMGINIANDAEAFTISNNYFTGCAAALRVTSMQNLLFERNQVSQGAARQRGGDAVFAVSESSGVVITHNVVLGGADLTLAVADTSPDLDLSENYWNGCPFLLDFFIADADVLDVINPINSKQCFQVDHPYYIVDADGDGWDDAMCVSAVDVQCL
jgi:parallel beta-helix repeat protein